MPSGPPVPSGSPAHPAPPPRPPSPGSTPAAGRLGATHLGAGRTRFQVWAPAAARVDVRLLGAPERVVPLAPCGGGYHAGEAAGAGPGSRYLYQVDGTDLPDPASAHQPLGVHGPSAVDDPAAFAWSGADAAWRGVAQEDLVLYELHVGTFTAEGTFDGVAGALDGLRELGVTAVELMPVGQFPGQRGWGYDGVLPFAVQQSYGGPEGLRRLVDACHRAGLAAFLDVVYNHLGPEGNVLAGYGPYFNPALHTPWGAALNFDGPGSDGVRRYFVENAARWLTDFHLDGLRLDAVHAIHDRSAVPFLQELADALHGLAAGLGRPFHLIAESDLNDPRLIRPRALGGYGLDAQWSDDFHHALHALLTGERGGYYQDFGRVEDLARALRHGYAYTGQPSSFRGRRHGAPTAGCHAGQFVVYAQNHDQIGNRPMGDRLASRLPAAALRLAAGVVLLSPFLPLLFMGEEYGAGAPFQFFCHYGDAALVEAVRRGRHEEFAGFPGWEETPDPQSAETFARCRLDRPAEDGGRHTGLRAFYREALRLRRQIRPLASTWEEIVVHAMERERALLVVRGGCCAVFSFRDEAADLDVPLPPGRWRLRLDAADALWGGPGGRSPEVVDSAGGLRLSLPPWACLLWVRDGEGVSDRGPVQAQRHEGLDAASEAKAGRAAPG